MSLDFLIIQNEGNLWRAACASLESQLEATSKKVEELERKLELLTWQFNVLQDQLHNVASEGL